ncbi:MAG: zinc-dependent metalloprotease, partial [Rhodothermaceae bacterium]|nr:zinc-dependent metalloprotease [Rhodothermaceae bacterium]
MKSFLITAAVMFLHLTLAFSQPSITEKTAEMEKYEGFFTYWWDESTGKIWLEIDKQDEEFIYVNSLAAGVGSNDIGLDRNQLGNTRIVKFVRVGPKVLMIQPNYDYRASSENELERKSVDEAFAQSVLFGFEVAATEDGRVLVDASDFLMQDAHGVTDRLRSSNQGTYSVDKSRSAIYLPGTFNFPLNTEFETILTLTGTGAGGWLRSVTPTPESVTVRQHHSFVALPDDGYKPRRFDPRSGYYPLSYQDYSAPIGGNFNRSYIVRHRLEKKDPTAEVSEAVEPVVYYLDNGTPEPVRTALLDGARWWAEVFEAAGYRDAFRVEVLSADAHPLDVRYNVINWVHRSTRGWSYGSSVVDPRTGEIIKGHVLLGSLRVRQDYLIAEGLLAPYEDGAEPDPQMLEMALDRIRQLSAHEVGHTLGIAHNFAASTNNLASVMDYPHPMATLHADGTLSLENAYGTGIGEWDKRAVLYGYQHFPDDVDEDEALEEVIRGTIGMGLHYLSDEVARPAGGSHPAAHLWEYGSDVVAQLGHILDIREAALARFGERNIRTGRPMSDLENVLVPVYMFHRYQTEATVKLIGGVDYAYSMRGDGQPGPNIVEAQVQQAALEAMLRTLDPAVLALPEHILDLIPPNPIGVPNTREQFRGYTTPVPDPVAMAELAADHSASLIFNAQRASRLVNQAARNSAYPGLETVVDAVLGRTILAGRQGGYNGIIQRAVNMAVLRNLIVLAGNEGASPDARAVAGLMLNDLGSELARIQSSAGEAVWKAHYSYLAGLLEQYKKEPLTFSVPTAPYTPPGAPIGSGEVPAM